MRAGTRLTPRLIAAAALLGLLAAAPWVSGQALARVELSFSPPDEVWVGQQVGFYVEVLTPTKFADPPRFDLPRVPGAILLKPQMFPLTTTRTVDGREYTVQSHQFAVYAQRPGEIVVPPIRVRVSSNREATDSQKEGEEVTHEELETEPLRFAAALPPGAESLSVLVTTKQLEVREVWEPQPGNARVGAAFTRTITWKAPDVLAMAFPPLPELKIEGIALYDREPVLRDAVFRGQMTGERTDSMTYVCERAGEYRLPALVIPWFDLDAGKLERVELPGVTFQVVGGDDVEAEALAVAGPADSGSAVLWLVWAFAVVAVVGLLAWWRGRLQGLWQTWCHARQEREPAYFSSLEDACRSADPGRALTALLAWLECTNTGPQCSTLAAFVATHEDPLLRQSIAQLEDAALLSGHWSGGELAEALGRARAQRARVPDDGRFSLPPLNPES